MTSSGKFPKYFHLLNIRETPWRDCRNRVARHLQRNLGGDLEGGQRRATPRTSCALRGPRRNPTEPIYLRREAFGRKREKGIRGEKGKRIYSRWALDAISLEIKFDSEHERLSSFELRSRVSRGFFQNLPIAVWKKSIIRGDKCRVKWSLRYTERQQRDVSWPTTSFGHRSFS